MQIVPEARHQVFAARGQTAVYGLNPEAGNAEDAEEHREDAEEN
jgi:hypothetical protein